MPIYDYQCTSCGYKKEVMRKVSEPNVTACPECGKESFTKQVSAPNFQLSGSGWYATDFKNGNKKPEDKTEKLSDNEKPSDKEKSSDKTESKPAETTTATPAPCATGCACH